jgi:hypothetical protein
VSIFIIILNGVRLSPLGIVATIGLLYQLQMIYDGDCGAIGGMKMAGKTQLVLWCLMTLFRLQELDEMKDHKW